MSQKPTLADLPIVNRRYDPGDCLIVRVASNLTTEQVRRITRAVIAFAGTDVSVAVVNVMLVQVMLVNPGAEPIILTPLPTMPTAQQPGRANLDLACVPFEPGSRLWIKTRTTNKQAVVDYFKNWIAGKDVEIFVEIVT